MKKGRKNGEKMTKIGLKMAKKNPQKKPKNGGKNLGKKNGRVPNLTPPLFSLSPPPARRATPLPGDASLVTFRGHSVLHTLLRCRLAPPGGAPVMAAGSAEGAVLSKEGRG